MSDEIRLRPPGGLWVGDRGADHKAVGHPVQLSTVACGAGGIDGVIGQAPAPVDSVVGQRHAGLIVYVKAPDVAATLAGVERHGGRRILGADTGHPGMIIAQFEDPDGNRFGL